MLPYVHAKWSAGMERVKRNNGNGTETGSNIGGAGFPGPGKEV